MPEYYDPDKKQYMHVSSGVVPPPQWRLTDNGQQQVLEEKRQQEQGGIFGPPQQTVSSSASSGYVPPTVGTGSLRSSIIVLGVLWLLYMGCYLGYPVAQEYFAKGADSFEP